MHAQIYFNFFLVILYYYRTSLFISDLPLDLNS